MTPCCNVAALASAFVIMLTDIEHSANTESSWGATFPIFYWSYCCQHPTQTQSMGTWMVCDHLQFPDYIHNCNGRLSAIPTQVVLKFRDSDRTTERTSESVFICKAAVLSSPKFCPCYNVVLPWKARAFGPCPARSSILHFNTLQAFTHPFSWGWAIKPVFVLLPRW